VVNISKPGTPSWQEQQGIMNLQMSNIAVYRRIPSSEGDNLLGFIYKPVSEQFSTENIFTVSQRVFKPNNKKLKMHFT
jgi:hypothetical protein